MQSTPLAQYLLQQDCVELGCGTKAGAASGFKIEGIQNYTNSWNPCAEISFCRWRICSCGERILVVLALRKSIAVLCAVVRYMKALTPRI